MEITAFKTRCKPGRAKIGVNHGVHLVDLRVK